MAGPVSSLTGSDNYFEDFEAGQKMRHARGCTVDEVENQLLTKLVMNSADGHFNQQKMEQSPFGQESEQRIHRHAGAIHVPVGIGLERGGKHLRLQEVGEQRPDRLDRRLVL